MVVLRCPPTMNVAPAKVPFLLAVHLELAALMWRILGQCWWRWGCECLYCGIPQGDKLLYQGSRYLEQAVRLGIWAQGLWLPRVVEMGDPTPEPAPALHLGLAAVVSLCGHGLILWALGWWFPPPPEPPHPPKSAVPPPSQRVSGPRQTPLPSCPDPPPKPPQAPTQSTPPRSVAPPPLTQPQRKSPVNRDRLDHYPTSPATAPLPSLKQPPPSHPTESAAGATPK